MYVAFRRLASRPSQPKSRSIHTVQRYGRLHTSRKNHPDWTKWRSSSTKVSDPSRVVDNIDRAPILSDSDFLAVMEALHELRAEVSSMRKETQSHFGVINHRLNVLEDRLDHTQAKLDLLEIKRVNGHLSTTAPIYYPPPFVPGGDLPTTLREALILNLTDAALDALTGAPDLQPLPSNASETAKQQHFLDYLGLAP
ncbi:hypothetical protein CPB85DRAFT_1345433 [Mucidula mucida]|nr:hypothetical protein CPB85DRAFT_1345433 [Mucidula mucida]